MRVYNQHGLSKGNKKTTRFPQLATRRRTLISDITSGYVLAHHFLYCQAYLQHRVINRVRSNRMSLLESVPTSNIPSFRKPIFNVKNEDVCLLVGNKRSRSTTYGIRRCLPQMLMPVHTYNQHFSRRARTTSFPQRSRPTSHSLDLLKTCPRVIPFEELPAQ